MVCLGNICRSPLAAGILKKKLADLGKIAIVDSAGFEKFHVGDKPDNRAIFVAMNNKIDITPHRARLFKAEDFDIFDNIYVMDQHNYHDVIRMARNETDRLKVDYIMNMINNGKNQQVPDPYYGSNEDFEYTFKLLDTACEKIVVTL